MALPELTLPDGTPAWLADGHSIELVPLYADVTMRTGHSRRRRVYTTAPRLVAVGLQLTAAQMLAFHTWFEDVLQAGALPFSTQVANQGPGLLWWRAQFAEPYSADAGEAAASFRVSARLLLTGTGSTTGPYVPAMSAAIGIALAGSAAITAPMTLSADVSVALLPVTALAAAVVIALVSMRDGAPPAATDFEKRWIWMRYPYARGRSADVTDTQEFNQRSWMGV